MRRNAQITLLVLQGEPMRYVAKKYGISSVRVQEIFWTEVNKVVRRLPSVREALDGAPPTHQLGVCRAHSIAIAGAITYEEGGDGTGAGN
jgi:hypothetical protein